MKYVLTITICVLIGSVSERAQQTQKKTRYPEVAAEIVLVPELPLTIHEAALVKTDKGYVLKCRVSTDAEVSLIGLRYSLTEIDPITGARPITNRIEGFDLAPYTSKSLTFPTPIRFRKIDGSRLVLMLEQVVSRESIWEVIKAKDVLEAYVKGDYSIEPHVLRVANQVDAPLQTRVIY